LWSTQPLNNVIFNENLFAAAFKKIKFDLPNEYEFEPEPF